MAIELQSILPRYQPVQAQPTTQQNAPPNPPTPSAPVNTRPSAHMSSTYKSWIFFLFIVTALIESAPLAAGIFLPNHIGCHPLYIAFSAAAFVAFGGQFFGPLYHGLAKQMLPSMPRDIQALLGFMLQALTCIGFGASGVYWAWADCIVPKRPA